MIGKFITITARNRRFAFMVSVAVVTVIVFLALYGHFPDHKENTNPLILADKRFVLPVDHSTIEGSIDLAKGYIDSLYKANYSTEVDSPNEAVMSEYPSDPLRVKLPNGIVIRSGDDVKLVSILSPITSILSPITSISNTHNTKYNTNYDITFRWRESLIAILDILVLHVIINHNYWTGSTYGTKLIVIQKSFEGIQQHPPISYADVYLGSMYIGRAMPNKNGQALGGYVYAGDNDLTFRSIRYTERHSAELAYEWYLASGNLSKAKKLSNELVREGYHLHNDIYASLFGIDKNLTDNYLYESGPNGVYRDCYTEPQIKPGSYQYHSKICVFGVIFTSGTQKIVTG